ILGDRRAEGLGTPRPVADRSAVAADLERVLPDRDVGTVAGLGLPELPAEDPAGLLAELAPVPAATAEADPGRTAAALRAALEGNAMQLAATAAKVGLGGGPDPARLAPAATPPRDALDELLDAAAGRANGGEVR